MAIMVNTPARNCLKKKRPSLTSSKKNMRLWSLLKMAPVMSVKPRSRRDDMNTMQSTTESTRQSDLSTSVQMIDFTPPRNVNSHTTSTVRATLRAKGRPAGSNTSSCSVRHTRNRRTEAPNILEMKKNHAPVLYDFTPKRSSRYWYTDTRFIL